MNLSDLQTIKSHKLQGTFFNQKIFKSPNQLHLV